MNEDRFGTTTTLMTGLSRHESEPNTQGCVSGDTDAVLLAELDEGITLEVGVQLYLVHGGLYPGIGQALSGE